MSRELDRRDFSMTKIKSVRQAELSLLASKISDGLSGEHRVRIKSFGSETGNPAMVVSESAPAEKGNYVQRALDHVRNIGQVLGLAASQPAEFVADPNFQQTSARVVTVHLQQQYKGISIFHAAQSVHFAPDGAISDTVGNTITAGKDITILPKLSIHAALLKAAEYLAIPHPDEQGAVDQFGEPLNLPTVDLTGFAPKVIGTFLDKPDLPTVFESGPFGDEIKSSLIWFPLGNDLRLAWEFIITMPKYEGQYRTLVDSDTGEILYCHQLIDTVAAVGNVYRVDGGGARQNTAFPRPLADYGLPIPANLPAGFPDTWVAVDSTVGNSTNSHQGNAGTPFQGTVQNGMLTFNPANANGVDQEMLNLFYYCCCMHEYFYLLNFREADGNFQQDNFGRGGVQSDRVDARAHPGAVWGTANMFTPIDGSSPTMNMGLVTGTNRHTAFDSTVVFHEFMHGVTNRLVGGPQNVRALDDPQSGGMGEGWGDYIACTINKVIILGNWVLNNTGGIRNFPYDSNYPHHYGNVGTTVNGIDYSEVHNMGEIWCATLMEMNRNIGTPLGVQLVVDALKLSPANPSFLDMRDSILRALGDLLTAASLSLAQYATAQNGIWSAFAKFGMGVFARSNGASLSGIVADFTFGPIAQGDDMQPGEVLNPGQSITSASGRYRFIYQGDGNLVLYDGGAPLWASGTDGKPVGACIMQGDGNLVIYARGGQPIWASDTWRYPGSRLVVQDDGNVVIYRPDGSPVWATNTVQP